MIHILFCLLLFGCSYEEPDDSSNGPSFNYNVRIPKGFEKTGYWREGFCWIERIQCNCTPPTNSPTSRCGTFLCSDGTLLTTNCLYVAIDTFVVANDTRPAFHGGIAQIMLPNQQYAYINAENKLLHTSEDRLPQWDNLPTGMIPHKGKTQFGYIDKKGLFVIEPKFDDACFFKRTFRTKETLDDFAFVRSGSYWGLIDTNGNYVITPIYDKVEKSGSGPYIVAYKNGKCGLVSTLNGEVVVDLIYDYIEPHGTEYLHPFKLQEKWGVITDDNRIVIDPQYSAVKTSWYSNMTCIIMASGRERRPKTLKLLTQPGRIQIGTQWYTFPDEYQHARNAIMALETNTEQ